MPKLKIERQKEMQKPDMTSPNLSDRRKNRGGLSLNSSKIGMGLKTNKVLAASGAPSKVSPARGSNGYNSSAHL